MAKIEEKTISNVTNCRYQLKNIKTLEESIQWIYQVINQNLIDIQRIEVFDSSQRCEEGGGTIQLPKSISEHDLLKQCLEVNGTFLYAIGYYHSKYVQLGIDFRNFNILLTHLNDISVCKNLERKLNLLD